MPPSKNHLNALREEAELAPFHRNFSVYRRQDGKAFTLLLE
jgi:hypothetical protein